MNRGRKLLLETSLGLVLTAAPLMFGLAHAWSSLAAAAFLFFLLVFYPEALPEAGEISRFLLPLFFIFTGFLILQGHFFSYEAYSSTCEILKWAAAAVLFSLTQLLPRDSLLRLLGLIAVLGMIETTYGFWQAGSGSEKVLWQAKEAHLGFVTGTYLNRIIWPVSLK